MLCRQNNSHIYVNAHVYVYIIYVIYSFENVYLSDSKLTLKSLEKWLWFDGGKEWQ